MTAAATLAAPTIESRAESRSIPHPVLLIRHAATTWTGRRWCGRADPALSADGRRAAQALAAVVSGELAGRREPVTILVSSARRARQTATGIEAELRVAAAVVPDLLEVDVGIVEGLDWTGLETRHPDLAADVARGLQPDWPGGESRADVERRARRAAERIVAKAAVGPVVVVSHGGILHAIATILIDGGPPPGALGPAGILRLDPASRSPAGRASGGRRR